MGKLELLSIKEQRLAKYKMAKTEAANMSFNTFIILGIIFAIILTLPVSDTHPNVIVDALLIGIVMTIGIFAIVFGVLLYSFKSLSDYEYLGSLSKKEIIEFAEIASHIPTIGSVLGHYTSNDEFLTRFMRDLIYLWLQDSYQRGEKVNLSYLLER